MSRPAFPPRYVYSLEGDGARWHGAYTSVSSPSYLACSVVVLELTFVSQSIDVKLSPSGALFAIYERTSSMIVLKEYRVAYALLKLQRKRRRQDDHSSTEYTGGSRHYNPRTQLRGKPRARYLFTSMHGC